jgi:hypothetical protein
VLIQLTLDSQQSRLTTNNNSQQQQQPTTTTTTTTTANNQPKKQLQTDVILNTLLAHPETHSAIIIITTQSNEQTVSPSKPIDYHPSWTNWNPTRKIYQTSILSLTTLLKPSAASKHHS